MAELTLRQKAIDDLSNIWENTAEAWFEKQADKYHSMIIVACENIANDVVVGSVYHNISSDLLGYKTGKHIIFHQYFSENEIEVIRILHERIYVESRLKE